MFDLGIVVLEFENNIVIFEISTKFVQLQNFVKKDIFLNLGPKIGHLGTFGQEF